MPDVLFLPECFADTALVTMLLPSATLIDHSFGVHNVVKTMKSASISQPMYKIIGIIDKDVTYKAKYRPPYFDDFTFVDERDRITHKQKTGTDQHLIMLDKAVDSFLLWNANEVDIDVTNYGFSPELREFCKAMKRATIGSDPNYLQLLTDLHTRQAPGFITLENILNDFFTP
ncbi:hypothetical protein [Larkinella punicea]|uniref:DUF4276 family protein n=1 Tax=Larkinella punicea TaxID=2315727 RepID=A0A368JG95_9BACT|nr:hypothetical protein [Larkinella punicea]RCR65714.1 hypothetical protein DUE52_30260 [Larkinella punicea]